MKVRIEDIAISFYYLASNVLEFISEHYDDFGQGQIELLDSLYPYAKAIEDNYKGRDCPGVFAYEIADDLASRVMVQYMELFDEFPSIKDWENAMSVLIDEWSREKIKVDGGIEKYVNLLSGITQRQIDEDEAVYAAAMHREAAMEDLHFDGKTISHAEMLKRFGD